MPHFDPDESTTHDVVRQAIIPMSLQIWSLRSFVVRVHSAKCSKRGTRSSDGLCVVDIDVPGKFVSFLMQTTWRYMLENPKHLAALFWPHRFRFRSHLPGGSTISEGLIEGPPYPSASTQV